MAVQEKYISPEKRQQVATDLRLLINNKKMINLLDNTPNQPSKFRTRNWVEIKESHGERIVTIVMSNLKLQ